MQLMIDRKKRLKDFRLRDPAKRGPRLKKILPPPTDERAESGTISLRPSVWRRLQEVADASKKEDPKGKGYSRNGVIQDFIDWALEAYDEDRARRKK